LREDDRVRLVLLNVRRKEGNPMNQKPNPHTLNGGESVYRDAFAQLTLEAHHYLINGIGAQFLKQRIDEANRLLYPAWNPDATLPAFSTVSEPEIDAALMPLVNEESNR
jgi:hypothetical protein